MARLGQQIESVDQFILQKHLADIPAHALLEHGLGAAEPVEDFERALGEADRARARRQRVVVVEQHDRQALPGEIDRGGQTDRAGADHDDGMNAGGLAVVLDRAPVVEAKLLVIDGCQVGCLHLIFLMHKRICS